MPTYSPFTEANTNRPFTRLSQRKISDRLDTPSGRIKPGVYFDAIDSILNIRPDIKLVVADGRSTDSIRTELVRHNAANLNYDLKLYPDRTSQWLLFNDIFENFAKPETKYFIYTSSDVIWQMDWVAEAIKEFERNPKLQILFPTVNNGDGNIPFQVATGPRDEDPSKPPYDQYGKAPVLNAYVMIFRMDFLRTYGGYPTIFRNCFTESFLWYLCEAVKGEMCLLPRGWCYHWGTVDIWQHNGSHYYFNEERWLFDEIMTKVQMAHGAGLLTPQYLKKLLWRK